MSIVQGPVSVAPCQTLLSRFATCASVYKAVMFAPDEEPLDPHAALPRAPKVAFTAEVRACRTEHLV